MQTERLVSSWSRHSNIKGGCMIVLKFRKLTLSTDFFMEKMPPFFSKTLKFVDWIRDPFSTK